MRENRYLPTLLKILKIGRYPYHLPGVKKFLKKNSCFEKICLEISSTSRVQNTYW